MSRERRERIGASIRRTLYVVLALNVAVVLAKTYAGLRANSLALFGDALQSTLDALNNVVALVLIHYASAPPDLDHPYGHRRFETLGAFVLAGILFVTAFELIQEAVHRLFFEPVIPEITGLTVAIVVVTLLVNVGITVYERWQAKRLGSELLKADAAHTLSDVWISMGVLAGFGLQHLGLAWADPVITLLIAVVVAWTGYRIFLEVAPVLTDRAPYDPEEVERVVLSVPGVESVHDVRSRGHRDEAYVQMHLVVEHRDIDRAHAVTEAVEEALRDELGAKEVLVHLEPEADEAGVTLPRWRKGRGNPEPEASTDAL